MSPKYKANNTCVKNNSEQIKDFNNKQAALQCTVGSFVNLI